MRCDLCRHRLLPAPDDPGVLDAYCWVVACGHTVVLCSLCDSLGEDVFMPLLGYRLVSPN